MEVDHHEASAFSPFLFAIIIDSLNTRKGAPWQVMLVYDVVLCEMEKRVLEVDLDQWRTALEKIGTNVAKQQQIHNRPIRV